MEHRLIEAGQAFMQLEGLEARDAHATGGAAGSRPVRAPAPRAEAASCERFEVVVIGGGQAGLSVGYELARRGLSFVILDASARVGDSWRRRWDSLRLFSPARYDGLNGMRFPGPGGRFPTKDEMADYLEAYAVRFKLPVRNGVRVDRVLRVNGKYVVAAGAQLFEAEHVVIATASAQHQRVPAFARELDPKITQLRSTEYRNPGQLQPGTVLLAGAGNSGAEIALDLARSHRTVLAGRDTGAVPFRVDSWIGRYLLSRIVLRFVFHYLLTLRTPLGRKLHAKGHAGGPLVRVKHADLNAAGVERAPRIVSVQNGQPVLEDGRVLAVENVVWCTGYDPAFSFIELPIFDAHGAPRHRFGVVADQPGLYLVGMHFQYAMSSIMIHGMGRDAARVVKTIAKRQRAGFSSRAA